MKWKIILIVFFIVIISVGYKIYDEKINQESETTYDTSKVVRMDLVKKISATGIIQPLNDVEVSSKITARIKEILVKENDHVKSGQPLAILEDKDYKARYDKAIFDLTNAAQKMKQMQELYEIGAISLQDCRDAQYKYDLAKSELELAEHDVNQTIITAPMDGVIVGEPETPGTMAVQGTTNPTVIMRIADLSKKLVKAKIDETDIGNVKVGNIATFTVDAYPDKTFKAEVTKISQTDTQDSWNTNTSSNVVIYYYVTFSVINDDNFLLPGMTARLDVNVGQVRNAICVPISTLNTDPQGSYVERVTINENGKEQTEKIYVDVGLYGEDFVEVTSSNLNVGDELVLSFKSNEKTTESSRGKNRGFRGF